MMKTYSFIAGVLMVLVSTGIHAQQLLTLEEAIATGLENNYNILIARNNELIAGNRNNAGNAGFLPTVSANGSVSYTSNNTTQKFFSGDERQGTGAGNTAIRAGVAVRWTAFDGFRMYAVRDRLLLEEQRSKAFTRSEMQDLATQIQNVYYGMARIGQQIEITEQSIQLNLALRELADAKLKIGTGTSLEVLQTSNRLSVDSSALLNLGDQLVRSQIALNRLIRREPGIRFSVPAELPPAILPDLEELTRLALQENQQLQLLNFDEQIALTQIKEARASLYPNIELNAGYNYNFSRAEVGFLLSNRSFGPTVGITATYDIFTGRSLKKEIANAELFKENVNVSKSDLMEDIKANMANLYQEYQALLELEQLENRNLDIAGKNTVLARQLYRSGRATNFDVRQAILEETQVKDRLSDVQFRTKLAEIAMKSLAGIPLYGNR